MNINKTKSLKVFDIFCGGGLGALGILKSGASIVGAIDNSKYAAKTYNLNIGYHCKEIDIRNVDIDSLPYFDVLMASPVCKSFSPAGKQLGFNDSRYGDLMDFTVNIIKDKKPKAFVIENVAGMTHKKNIDTLSTLLEDLKKTGYKVNYRLVNLYEIFGLPQKRIRLVIVGVLNNYSGFEFPEPIKHDYRLSICDMIYDLPEPSIYPSEQDIKNHYGYGIRPDELSFIDKIRVGHNWRDLDSADAEKFLGKAFFNGGGRTGFLRKVDIFDAAFTITATANGKNNAQILDTTQFIGDYTPNLNNVYLKPSLMKMYKNEVVVNRRFTVREALRLQGVPDSFYIPTEISLQKQYEIVGNGIPPILTEYIFKKLSDELFK